MTKNTSTDLSPNIKDLIDKKASEECEDTALLYASTFIHQLNDHINGICILSSEEIDQKIDCLGGCLTITLDIRVNKLEFIRARRFNKRKVENVQDLKFKNVQELSYIKDPKSNFPAMGRLNQIGEALFYASLAVKKDDTPLKVVLSEVRAKDLDVLNVLRSHQKDDCDMNLRIIGIWDYVRRDDRPYYLDEEFFNYYKKAAEYMESKFSPALLTAYQLTDRFFADILSRKGSERLYEVTSCLCQLFLEDDCVDCVDGVLYPSVEAIGEPVVALKPLAVDKKLEHQWVFQVKVDKWFGYEFFDYKTLEKTKRIDASSGELVWGP